MIDTATSVLLVAADPGDAGLIRASLAESVEQSFRVDWVRSLAAALDRLGTAGVEVVLLDLALPDSQGIAGFEQVFAAAPDASIIVLSTPGDEPTARQAVQRGAHDYLVKGQVDGRWLRRGLRYLSESRATRGALKDSGGTLPRHQRSLAPGDFPFPTHRVGAPIPTPRTRRSPG